MYTNAEEQKEGRDRKKLFGFVMETFCYYRLLFMMTDDEIETNDCIFTIPMRVQTVNEMTECIKKQRQQQ